ncbi:hypothetical protein FisN_3Lh154 [Fistulifera solaris]|uniref:Domain of unknown function at the cortex 1 domain-containing protein n=1 Tax=Fistulifera solaris TaxID=1519565 RepID=A0A1Z5JHV8_FISSO|nr:hypothetical protein FisN_3Lh154 [Fistulifera solaris]|eukprot:GAX13584.1 hypothetical protein FisN_3Lh154 [Fistulifera solaris]
MEQVTEGFANSVSIADVVDAQLGQHPALDTMCVMNCQTKQRIIPNSSVSILDNEAFTGQVMLLVRTPDVDDPLDGTILSETPARISKFFSDKKRRFEFQFQIKLKKVPEGPLFLGCELEHQIKCGTITKAMENLLLTMVRRINPGFHYSWGPEPSKKDYASGTYEKTHLSFPVEASMDRIIVSKPGETPPELGYELFESNESVKRRRKMGAGSVVWNLEDTYTMCLWSAYCDWILWKSLNVPGMAPFSLCRVTGQQPIYLSVYEVTGTTPAEYRKKRPPHYRKNLNVYTRLEFSNQDHTSGGLAETVLRRSKVIAGLEQQSLPDTDSVDSDFETASRISHITS